MYTIGNYIAPLVEVDVWWLENITRVLQTEISWDGGLSLLAVWDLIIHPSPKCNLIVIQTFWS